MPKLNPRVRIAELESELKRRDEQIKELKQERTDTLEVLDQMREHVKDAQEIIQQWVYTFSMEQDERGVWIFDSGQSGLWDGYKALLDEHQKLIRDWNRFVRDYNKTVAPRDQGRPLAASEAQVRNVLKRHKEGASLRGIASATSLTLRTVRTIIERGKGTDRTSKRRNELRRREFDRLRAADYRARKAARDVLPKQITETLKRGEALEKAAKGIGSN